MPLLNQHMNSNIFNGMMGPVAPGLCRMTPNGKIAIKTNNGYKTYNVKTGRLTNCANFVFELGEEFFFVVPTNHLKVGDIILVNGSPRCVIKAEPNEITALNYENSTKECVIPERHIFFGKSYMYGKIVSPMGNFLKGNNIMKYMMMSEMMKGWNGKGNTSFDGPSHSPNEMFGGMMNNPMGLMMMSSMFGGQDNLFDGLFDFDDEDETVKPASISKKSKKEETIDEYEDEDEDDFGLAEEE